MPEIRLQRAIAEAGVASRRGAEALISAGRVRVDGRPAVIGERVDVERQRVEVDGRQLGAPQRFVYLAVSKPAGVTSTVRDRHARRTVLDLVPASLSRDVRLYPIGRLDRDSEGLLLLTNDGALTERLLHPRYGVEREYAVALEVPLDDSQQDALRRGVELLEGGATLVSLRPATPAETEALGRLVWPPPDPAMAWYRVVLDEGRKRQVRRMFGAVGATVQRLVRVRIGPLELEDLAPGGVRALEAAEVERLRAAPGTPGVPSDGRAVQRRRVAHHDRGRDLLLERPPFHPAAESPSRPSARSGPRDQRNSDRPLERPATHGEVEARGSVPRGAPKGLVVALDGPGSSGKSSVGSAAAETLGYRFCDTGMLYRAVTWLSLDRNVPAEDGELLAALVPEVELVPEADGRLSRVLVSGADVTDKVASPRVDRRVSEVSAQPAVRASLLPRQRLLAEGGGIVMAGRDIGTVVLPDADLKLFLDASAEERARRRAEQRGLAADSPAAARILADLRRRDRIDATRPIAPLRQAPDAVVIRTDGNTVGQTIDAVVAAIRQRERELGTGGPRKPAR